MHHRREYRLLGNEGKESFQRVMYDPWRTIGKLDGKANQWQTDGEEDDCRIGVQFHALPGRWLKASPSWRSETAILLEDFDDLTPFLKQPKGRTQTKDLGSGESGSSSEGVTQSLKIHSGNAPSGKSYAVYEADNSKAASGGWSMMHRTLRKPMNLSQRQGIGIGMRGDGKGGKFKLQLHDGKIALDFYVDNDYTGWRYQQWEWPKGHKIDLTQIRSFEIYFNGIPANTKVAVGIDGIKAIAKIDEPFIIDPYVEIGNKRIQWKGKLKRGEYVVIWPEEPILHYQLDHSLPVSSPNLGPLTSVPQGRQDVRFGCKGGLGTLLRARITRQPAERHQVESAN